MPEREHPLAIVTGAARRLGKAFASALAEKGFAILLHYHHSTDQAEATAAELGRFGIPVELARADLTDADQIAALFALVDGMPYRLQLLVNSAAVMPRVDMRNLTAAQWDAVLDLNLRAPFLLAQAAAARMQAGGLIVNVSDSGANKAWSGYPAYTVSKAGLEALTRLLARAYAPRIRVNAIAPGLVLPSESVTPEEWGRLVDRLPLKRPASVREVTAALEYLLDNEAVTGQTIVVDGGYALV